MSAHSDLSPSSTDRWSRCYGSVNATRGLPRRSSKASAVGTAKHETSFWCLMHTIPTMTADKLLGQPWSADGFAGEIDAEFIDHVNAYLKGVRKAVTPGTQCWFELELDTSPVYQVPGQKGTGDAVLCRLNERNLYVGDAKFGFGAVQVKLNRQMLSYAAAALFKFDEFGALFDTVTLAVHQPRLNDLPQEFTVRAHLVRRWAAAIAKRAQKTLPADAPLIPGPKQCHWCDAKANCVALRADITSRFDIDPPDVERVPLHDNQALADALDRCDHIESWCRAVRAEALLRSRNGQTIPGYKEVVGRRGNRVITDPGALKAIFEAHGLDPYSKPDIVSVAEAQRRLKRAEIPYTEIEWLVDQPPGAPSLVKVNEAGTPVPRLEFGLEETA